MLWRDIDRDFFRKFLKRVVNKSLFVDKQTVSFFFLNGCSASYALLAEHAINKYLFSLKYSFYILKVK